MVHRRDVLFVDDGAIDLSDHIIATYRLQVSPDDLTLKLHDALSLLAFDPTIGTWTDSVRMTPGLIDQFSGKVLYPLPREEEQAPLIRIAIPMANIDPLDGGIPQLLGILGVPFTLKALTHLRLVDLSLPSSFVAALPRPRFGTTGLYSQIGIHQCRPLLATMLKPRVGLNTSQYVADAREALSGGIDIILDDEVMGSSSVSHVRERTRAMRQMIQEVCVETGEQKWYVPNVTTSIVRLGALAQELYDLGANALYVNPITLGFSALELLRTLEDVPLPLLCCRAMHGVFTRDRNHGISMYVLLKLARWSGADAMHVGSMKGKLPHAIVGDTRQVKDNVRAIRSPLRGTMAALPIVSGGLHPGNLPWTVQELGSDLIIQAGSGVLGHPNGPRAGARALRLVADGTCNGEPILDIAAQHEEVQVALRAWGYVVDDHVVSYEYDEEPQRRYHQQALEQQLLGHKRNLQKLELQIIDHGGLMNAPLALWNGLDATKRAINEIETELERLRG